MTTRRLILLLLMAIVGIRTVYSNPHSVLERYEERLNSALSKRTGVPRTVKRYKCVEEYVTYDQHGRAVNSYQGSKFTTTMEPPTYRTSGEKEIRRKPAKKVTIAINRDSEQQQPPLTTTQMTMTSSTTESTTSSLKPFDEMNDEEADRIIEEMYLKKKESHATESPEDVPEVIQPESPRPPSPPSPPSPPKQPHVYSTSSSSSNSGVPQPSRYTPVKQNRIVNEDSDEDYPSSVYHRGSRKRPYDMSTYDDYDDIPLYRPMRREYRMRRRRPILFSDDFSDDTDFDQRSTPRRQTTRDLSPLRSIKSLRHLSPQYRPPGSPPPPMSLPVSSSTNMIHRPMPLPMAPPHMRPPPGHHQMMPMPPGLGGPMPIAPPPPPQPLQPIQQQQSMMNHPGGDEVLKMKPILQANPQEMQVATEESCAKITKLAKSFNIKDVSKWARSNCAFLQMYAPTASCELIFHFIDSCRSKKFF